VFIKILNFFSKSSELKNYKNSNKIKKSKFSNRSKIELFDIGMERNVTEADF
jgi:hypothetical protein